MKWLERTCSTHWKAEKYIQNPGSKNVFKTYDRWKGTNKMNLKLIGWGSVDWIYVVRTGTSNGLF
jgi:hypothetical protein